MSFPRSISLSFPRRWESSLTISWIPFFKGMTSGEGCHSHASLSFPRRWESSLTISWIPFFKGMTRGRAVIPTKVGIQNKYLLDTLFRGCDKREGCHSHEGGNLVSPFPGSPLSR
ncbi:MAG: hypothetical protein SFT68_04775 [Rickettsiaceae bacterium]|nr:hypothetical protein [Rickettsiaceae bacterium]